MITEGIGRHAPSPVKQLLSASDIRIVASAAMRIAKRRGEYRTSSDKWKRGLIGELEIPGIGVLPPDASPLFVGLCAEAGLVLFLNRRLEMNLSIHDRFLEWGDAGADIDIGGFTMQVKSRQFDSIHARQCVSLVRYATDRGRNVFPASTVLVFCETNAKAKLVKLLGWVYSHKASQLPTSPARRGNHTNIEIADNLLEPMSALADSIIARRELAT